MEVDCVASLTRHDAEISLGLEAVEHLNDVWMLQPPENLYLPSQALDVLVALAALGDELDGNYLA
jgi:hypothetical protein